MRSVIENWTGTDAELLEALNAETIEISDSTYWTTRQISAILTAGEYEIFSRQIKAMATDSHLVADNFDTLKTTGLPFNVPAVQGMIDALAAMGDPWTPAISSKLKSLGLRYQSAASQALGRPATQADIDQERIAIQAQNHQKAIRERRQMWDVVSASIRSRIESGILSDSAAIVSAVQTELT